MKREAFSKKKKIAGVLFEAFDDVTCVWRNGEWRTMWSFAFAEMEWGTEYLLTYSISVSITASPDSRLDWEREATQHNTIAVRLFFAALSSRLQHCFT